MPDELLGLLQSTSGGGGFYQFRDLLDTPSSYSLNQLLFFGSDGVYSDPELYFDNISKIFKVGNATTTAKVNILDNTTGGNPALLIKTITGKAGSTCEVRMETTDANDQTLITHHIAGTRKWYGGCRGGIDSPPDRYFFGNDTIGQFITIIQEGGIGLFNTNPQAVLDTTPATIRTTSYTRPVPSMTTTQRDSLVNMPIGAGVYDNTEHSLRMYDGTDWLANNPANSVFVHRIEDLGFNYRNHCKW
jgi:hypothetical protein